MKSVCLFFVLAAAIPCSAETAPLLHLDAAAQTALRQKLALPPLTPGQPVDMALAAAGEQVATFHSELVANRPVFAVSGNQAVFRFDGTDDFLALSGPRRLAPAVTIFILAAPQGNKGYYPGFFACAEAGKNDYTSGLNLDLGSKATKELSFLNLESAGAGGERDLLIPGANLAADLPFGGFHVFAIRSQIRPGGNEVWLDGVKLAARDRLESNIGLDQMVLGARYYSNNPAQQPYIDSFFHGDIAELLVFDSALPDNDRKVVEQRLFAKVAELNAFIQGRSGHMLQTVKNPPPVQMLVPGFSVSELPVKLTNRNNLRYRHDGKLVALGYDGTIHLLTDTDGDGLEDRADVFWDKPTMRGPVGIALLPKNDPRGDGVFVPSKGKLSLILDRDRDGRADEEIIVASGWQEITQNVDAVGVAVDPTDGSIYFGLGTANFANAYLIDPATGKAAYDIHSDHGTIQKVSPDFKTRTTVCTGVRFTCALGFNRDGDLFATEQEGATWLPNGNPLDELLHIEPGKHYGFPPRHPKHLPDVLDWPAVVEYGPQHQSTVGMTFNEGVNGGPAFGPAFWAGDALVCGESRGKLYRTKLVKTPHGYVGQNQLIACLGLLTIDACVSPKGDLLVACHSGPPDWGTGPKGEGRIFKISYTGKDLPQPVWQWASAPDEFRIAFDRELQPAEWAGLVEAGQSGLSGAVRQDAERGRPEARPTQSGVRPAQKTEGRAGVPPAPRGFQPRGLAIEAGRYVSAGDRFEVIRPGYQVVRDQMAAPRRDVEVLGLSLSSDRRTIILRVPRQTEPVGYAVTLPLPELWIQKSPIPQLPEMDLLVTLNGMPHDFGTAHIIPRDDRYQLAVSDPFIPAVQPGASIDWKPEPAADPVAVKTPDGPTVTSRGHTLPVSASQTLTPWASAKAGTAPAVERDLPGNWLAGRRLFFSNEAACFTCHQIRGEGIAVGPDLTNLVFRDRDSVLNDILHPSATINPDHPASTVKLKNGTTLTGIVRTANDKELKVALQAGAVQVLNPADVAGTELLKTSLMPEGYAERLPKDQQTNLLKFLLTSPLEPAPIERTDPPVPAPRKKAEIEAILNTAVAPPDGHKALPPLRILLSAGPKDHGPGEHDYPLWQKRWAPLLRLADNVTVDTAWEFPKPEQLAAADVTVFFSKNPGFNPRTAMLLDDYQKRGGGLVYLHWALNGDEHADVLAERIGLSGGKLGVKFRHGEFDLVFTRPDHPVTAGFPTLHFTDETYWALVGDPARISILGHGVEEGEPRPQFWSMEREKGRVIGCVPGHYTWTFDDPLYRLLVLRSICWTGKQENTDRLSELATIGARITP